jgi:hypothetical protein
MVGGEKNPNAKVRAHTCGLCAEQAEIKDDANDNKRQAQKRKAK